MSSEVITLFDPKADEKIISAFQKLICSYPPNTPSPLEARTKSFKQWKQSHGGPCGIYRFTIHQQRGHPNQEPNYAAQFFGCGAQHTAAALGFRTSPVIHRLSEFISTVFAGIDPPAWAKYRETYVRAQDDYPLLRSLDPPLQCFVGYYLLVNVLTTIHRDVKDPPDGWVAMAVFGNYKNGELYLPDMKLSLSYKPRTVVFLRSWALRHFIGHFEGDR